jgi:hypothetical protein
VYTDRPDWQPEKLLDVYKDDDGYVDTRKRSADYYQHWDSYHVKVPLVSEPTAFDADNRMFLATKCGDERKTMAFTPTEPFLLDVALPMMQAYDLHKQGRTQRAVDTCMLIEADDWRVASAEWLKRRLK